MAQVAEHLPSKDKTLSPNTSMGGGGQTIGCFTHKYIIKN
jgi:hypothetical protein